MDLVRDILLAVEAHPYTRGPFDIDVPGYAPSEIGYHVMLLDQASLLTACDSSSGEKFRIFNERAILLRPPRETVQ
jgi:hypothetical protein